MMELAFWGAAGTVTGSKYLVTTPPLGWTCRVPDYLERAVLTAA